MQSVGCGGIGSAVEYALTQVAEAEARFNARQRSQTTLSEEERNRLLQLGSNLDAVWNDVSAPIELKKRINSNAYQ